MKLNELPDDMPNPAQQLDSEEQGQVIAASMIKLPDNQRTVLMISKVSLIKR
jgi:hypothetical protein